MSTSSIKTCENCGKLLVRQDNERPNRFQRRRFCDRSCRQTLINQTRTIHTRAIEDRFWSKVDFHGDCWEWTARSKTNGYGSFGLRKAVQRRAHVFAYELLVGPIPTGMQLDHLCRNRSCVNPDHLESVTQRMNLLRGATQPAFNLAKTRCPQGHPYEGDNLAFNKDGSRFCRTCSRDRQTIYNRTHRDEINARRRMTKLGQTSY